MADERRNSQMPATRGDQNFAARPAWPADTSLLRDRNGHKLPNFPIESREFH
jgi:hypothetical protein